MFGLLQVTVSYITLSTQTGNSIVNLRTGHAMTRSCQALHHLTDSKSGPFYRCVNIDETIDHILSECPVSQLREIF